MGLKKLIDLDLLDRFLEKLKLLIPTKTSDLTNDSGYMSGMTILSYGSSTWSDFITAYDEKKVVYCRASSNSNPASGSQTRLAFMAYVNNAATPTEVEFQYYRSVSSHTDAQQGDQVFVYKLNKTNGWSVITRNAFTKINVGTGLEKNYSNGTLTLSNGITIPNKNFLDNWYFVGGGSQNGYGIFPINQRSDTVYTNTGFNIDRWRNYNITRMTIENDGITLVASATGFVLMQTIPSPASFAGKTLTATALYSSVSGGTAGIRLAVGGAAYPGTDLSAGGLTSVTRTLTSSDDLSSIGLNIRLTQGTTAKLVAVKLEIGSTQTLAYQENGSWVLYETPDYLEQLTKCQAYLLPIKSYARTRASFCMPSRIDFDIPTMTTMVQAPSIIGTPRVSTVAGSAQSGFTFDVGSVSVTTVRVRATKTDHGMTDGFIDSGSTWYLSAE